MVRGDVSSPPVLAGKALRAAIREAVRKFLDLDEYRVFLFGSEAAGVAGTHSDVDVGILGPRPVPGAVLQRIRDELDALRTLRGFDVVDFSRTDDSFRAEALTHAEPL